MYRTLQLSIFLVFVSAAGSFAQNFSPVRLDSLFKALQSRNLAMGSVCITHNGKVIYSNAFGSVSGGVELSKPNTLTRYRIGSLTKVFTAVLALQLVQEHKLSLATPISKYFAGLPYGDKITVDMLMGHTSGLHDYTTDAAYTGYARRPATQADMLARIARLKPDFKPGEKSFYSNTNYLLLGYIVEKAGGKPYAAQLQQRIISKIGLQHTRYGAASNKPQANEALPYSFNGHAWLPMGLTDLSVPGGAGAIVSTPTDLAVFIRALFKLKLTRQASLTSMTPLMGNIGRGLVQVPVADQMAFGHFGIIDGFKNTLLYLPQTDLAVAVCFNSANTDDNAAVEQILSITLQQLSHKVNVAPNQLAQYVGTYTSRQLPIKITMRAASGYLIMQAANNQPLTLETISPTRFRFAKGDMVLDFTLLPNKQINHFTLKQADKVYEFFKE